MEGLKQGERFVTVNYVCCRATHGNFLIVFISAVFISVLRGFFLMTFGQKIAICAIFVFIRADEYHKTLTDVLRKVSVSNVGFLKTTNISFGRPLGVCYESALFSSASDSAELV